MPTTPVDPPWTPPVHNIASDRADLPLYEQLHLPTEAAARAVLTKGLQAISAESAVEDLTRPLQAALALLNDAEGEGATPGAAALRDLSPEAVEALRTGLAAHLAQSAPKQRHDDAQAVSRVARQMAAELARALWSTLLDHAVSQKRAHGLVAPDQLLPTWPEPTGQSSLHRRLVDDLAHFNLPLEDLIQITHTTMERLLAHHRKGLALPRGLRLDARQLDAFLQDQRDSQRRRRSRHAAAPARVRGERLQPAMTTRPLSAL